MAGDWIKMRVDLADDPAVIGIAAGLGLDEFSVVGRLQALWAWADSQSRDGHARGVTAAWINRKFQCDGFAEAMVSVGWLVVDATGITFPNFANHNGETAKTRALSKNRKQKERSKDSGHADGSDMSRKDRDESVTREEKRREEIPPTSVGGDAPRKRAAPALECPTDVDQQTWTDWLALRKAKKAPVTETVLTGARTEAGNAGMTLDAFLQVWCMRGSQGLQADWLKPHERQTQSRVASFADHDEQNRRRKWEEMTGRKWPESGEVFDVTPTTQRIAA